MRFSIEAEQSVIGGLLQDPNRTDEVLEITNADDFYNVDNRFIFAAICDMGASGKSVDVITLSERLNDTGELERVGGLGYLIELYNNTPSAANVKSYAHIVADRAMERRITEAGQRIAELGDDEGIQVDEKLEALHGELAGLERRDAVEVTNFDQIIKSRVQVIDGKFRGTAKRGLECGFKALDERFQGIGDTDLWILAARPAMGKELTNNSPVLLSNGIFKPIGDVVVGDIVASVDGKESVVTGHFPQGIKPVYRVTFSDGRYVDAGLEHQWEVNHRKWSSPRVMTTSDIIEKIKKPDYKSRLFVPNHSSDFGIDNGIVIHPYLMGVLIGNGGLSGGGVKFSSCQPHILEKIKPMLLGCDLVESGKDYRISPARGAENRIITELRKLGLFGVKSVEKFIPEIYLRASKESRTELIRGLIDTDGTVEKTGAMTYSTSSERLSVDFILLARSLGAFASVSSRIPNYSYLGEKKQGKRNYCIYLSCDNYGDFVTVPHKKTRIKNDKASRNLNIESIEYIGDFDCSCISVSHNRALYITKDYIVTHNTALAMNLVYNVARQGKEVIVFSMEMSKEQLTDRLISAAGGIPSNLVRSGQLTEEHWAPLSAGIAKLKGLKIHIIDIPAIDIHRAKAIARKFKRNGEIGLIMVDYLQLMRDTKAKTRFDEVSSVSRELKVMAKMIGCPVLALSQLNRGVEGQGNKRPGLKDLRESGQIEQDADLISFIYRDEYYNEDSPNKNTAEIITAKFREGEVGTDVLGTQPQFSRFVDIDFSSYIFEKDEPKKDYKKGGFN